MSELASMLGMHRGTLSNYERGKANLSPAVALDICRKLDLSPRWLATGTEPLHPFITPEETGVSTERFLMARGTFLEAYRKVLSLGFESFHGRPESSGKITRRASDVMSGEYLRRCSVDSLIRHIRESSRKLAAAHSEEEILRRQDRLLAIVDEIKTRSLKKIDPKLDATRTTGLRKRAMPQIASLSELRDLLIARTQRRGRRAALAEFLGVTRTAVSRYLAGKSSPSAEITIKLLLWLENEAGEEQSPNNSHGES